MIGIVVVSHSGPLAHAAIDLARDVLPASSPLALVGAGGLADGSVGTDTMRVCAAIEAADDGDGVLVLCDVGSSVLSADLALEFLADDVAARCLVSPAPLVEGLIAAAVSADAGRSLADVEADARRSLEAKQSHLSDANPARPQPEEPMATPSTSSPHEIVFVCTDPHGLHIRPAAQLLATLKDIDAEVSFENQTVGKGPNIASSVISLASLGIQQGHQVRVRAQGRDADEAIGQVRSWLTAFGRQIGA